MFDSLAFILQNGKDSILLGLRLKVIKVFKNTRLVYL